LAQSHGFEATSATQAISEALSAGAKGEPVIAELATRVALGVVAVCVVVDPAVVVLAGEVSVAGGAVLAARVQERVNQLAPVTPRVVVSGVAEDPVLQGALLTGLAAIREEVFTSTLA
jgi:predicted NBD/HSP70 family sugar kinase